MNGIRRAISGGAVVGVALLGLLVVASAPAAAGPSSVAGPFLTGALVRGQPPRALEIAGRLSIRNARGSSKLDSTLAKVARRANRGVPSTDAVASRGLRSARLGS